MSTKKRILASAMAMFNESGYDNTNMVDIADTMNISRGNLAYHYKNKGLLLKSIGEMLSDDIEINRSQKRDFPAFSNLQIDIKTYFQLQKKYLFIFANNTVLHHIFIQSIMQDWAHKTIEDNTKAFAFAVNIGNMKKERYPGIYQNLALNTWILIYYWLSQKEVRGLTDSEDAEKMVWSILIPHFTDQGIQAFNSYYGPQFLQSMGEPLALESSESLLF